MAERLDEHNVSVDTPLAAAGACAQIHLPTGGICTLPHHHHESCEFQSPADIADTEKLPRHRARRQRHYPARMPRAPSDGRPSSEAGRIPHQPEPHKVR